MAIAVTVFHYCRVDCSQAVALNDFFVMKRPRYLQRMHRVLRTYFWLKMRVGECDFEFILNVMCYFHFRMELCADLMRSFRLAIL